MSKISNAFSRSFSDDADRLSLASSNENSNDSWTSCSSVPNCSPFKLQQMVEAARDAQREYRAAVEQRKRTESCHDKRADTAEFHKALDAALCVHAHSHENLTGHRH